MLASHAAGYDASLKVGGASDAASTAVPELVATLVATAEVALDEALDVAALVVIGVTCSAASVPESRVPAS